MLTLLDEGLTARRFVSRSIVVVRNGEVWYKI
jgi:hypothetical protein